MKLGIKELRDGLSKHLASRSSSKGEFSRALTGCAPMMRFTALRRNASRTTRSLSRAAIIACSPHVRRWASQ